MILFSVHFIIENVKTSKGHESGLGNGTSVSWSSSLVFY